MERLCLHCQTPMPGARANKKYCNDTCKQMAYFQRNGLVLSGKETETVKYVSHVVRELPLYVDSQECVTDKTVNIKEDTEEHPFSETVKYTSKITVDTDEETAFENEEENIGDNNTDAEQALTDTRVSLDHLALNEEKLINDDNVEEKTTRVKYPLSSQLTIDSIESLLAKHMQLVQQKFDTALQSVKLEINHHSSSNPITQKTEPTINTVVTQTTESVKPGEVFTYVESGFLRRLERHLEQHGSYDFGIAGRSWPYDAIKAVQWINPRLRCLLESLIRLSNYAHIDYHTLLCLADAFYKLVLSRAFNNLPDNYPFTKLIFELNTKLQHLVVVNLNATKIVFRLPQKRKAEVAGIRFRLLEITAQLKFSELDFTEEPSKIQLEQKAKPEKRLTETWQDRFRKIQREQNLNKAA